MRFADHFAREHGVEYRFCVYDVAPQLVETYRRRIAAAFPALAGSEVYLAMLTHEGAVPFEHLKESDAAIATFWTSAFPLLRLPEDEGQVLFRPGLRAPLLCRQLGVGAGRADVPLRLPRDRQHPWPVRRLPRIRQLGRGVHARGRPRSLSPAGEAAAGGAGSDLLLRAPQEPAKCVRVGSAALSEVKQRFGDRVDIVCAGENWVPGEYGLADVLATWDGSGAWTRWRTSTGPCHIGLVLMLTKHPSYQPFEFMASGVACVTNENPSTGWFLRHDENALLAPAAPTPIADRIVALVEDRERRERLVTQGLAQLEGAEWEGEIERVWRTITRQQDFEGPPADARALPRFGGPPG